MVVQDFYTSGEYLKNNPDWHVDAAPWKTDGILQMMDRHRLKPKSICEVGCGAGEILRLLQQRMDADCTFVGYEIAPQAVELAKTRENERLHFKLADFREERDAYYDLILIIDVLEHFEDMFGLLRDIKKRSKYKILQLPLDIHVGSVLRNELIDFRHATGHLHFFTKDIALATLRENGYDIVDYFYTIPDLPAIPWKLAFSKPARFAREFIRFTKRGLQRLPGNIFYMFNKDLAVRIFGGWRLVVLVR